MSYRSAIIHLSDLETGENNRADPGNAGLLHSNPYISLADAIVADVRAQLETRGEGAKVGLVVSGDIASKGRNTEEHPEYAKAIEVITRISGELSIPKNLVAVVPGNHDINWSRCEEAYHAATGRKTIKNEADQKMARALPEKLQDFSGFFRQICDQDFAPREPIVFRRFLELGVAIVGLDSTYPSTFREIDNFGQVQDDQIEKAGQALKHLIDDSGQAEVVPMALMHHSPCQRSSRSGDTSALSNMEGTLELLEHAGFRAILCGHEHHRDTTSILHRRISVLVTGSCGARLDLLQERYQAPETNRYQILFLNPGAQSRLIYRILDPFSPGRSWKEDTPADVPIVLSADSSDLTRSGKPRAKDCLLIGERKNLSDGNAVIAVSLANTAIQAMQISRVEYSLAKMGDEYPEAERVEGDPEANHTAAFRVDPSCSYRLTARISSEDSRWNETKLIKGITS